MHATAGSGSHALAWLALAIAGVPAAARDLPPLHDPQDGAFDLSAALDTTFGFVPVLSPITEPAVGYGLAGALVFVDRNEPVAGRPVRPNLAAIGGLATANGTNGVFAAHIGTWLGGRLRTVVAAADADVNLEFFGLGASRGASPDGLKYRVSATGAVGGASYQVGDRPVWLGARYAHASTRVAWRDRDVTPPGLLGDDTDLALAALTPSLTIDTRDNLFTPQRGVYLDVAAPLFREGLGSDRDFELLKITGMYFHAVGPETFLGVRGALRDSSSQTPFFLRPFVMLRGVQAMKYQGEQTAEVEGELRWQWRPRWSVVGFAGTGVARSEQDDRTRSEDVVAGGAGFRYLLARTYGLHLGLDLAWGPDDPVIYVVFGSAWMRP